MEQEPVPTRASRGVRLGTRLAPVVTGIVPRVWGRFADRPATWAPAPGIAIDHWIAVSDHLHNMTTDLAHWRGHFWLVHAASPWHMASAASRIVVWRSTDARVWERVAELRLADGDIRDPKL